MNGTLHFLVATGVRMLPAVAALVGATASAGEIAGRSMAWAHYVPWFKPENASLEALLQLPVDRR